MQKWQAFLNKQSLRTRFITWFLLIALIPLAWTTFIAYEMSKKILFDQATTHLQNLIFRQEKIFNFYFQEKRANARDFIRDQTALEAVSTLGTILTQDGKDSIAYQKAYQKFYSILAFHIQALDYYNLLLINKTGTLVFSVLPTDDLGKNLLTSSSDENVAKIFERSRDSLKTHMLSLVLKPDKDFLKTFITVPIIDSHDQLVGTALIELSTSSMYNFLSNFKELGILEDLIVVAKINDHLFALPPNPIQASTDTQQPVNPNSSLGKFIQQVLTQHKLIANGINYDDQKTLMVGKKFLNASNWALITKINETDLLNPISRFQYLFWILAATTAAAVIWAASHVARKLAAPLLALTEKTKILAEGDLSQRIEVTSQDEIGRLGQSFNEMAAQLDHTIRHLDDLVAKRTEEYGIQNIKLEHTIKELHVTRDRLITQEKLASLGALTAGIAHEIKNPLNFINNFAELSLQLQEELDEHLIALKSSLTEKDIQEFSDLSKTLKLNISKIYEHGKRADSIIYHMLQHSRSTPGERRSINIHKLLDEYIDLAYHGMRAQDSTFNVKIEKDYDPSVSFITVVPQEMSRVFLNLLNNAYYSVQQKKKQSSTETSYQPTVRISTKKQKDSLSLTFWDNGMGIAPDVLPKLFTPFFTTKPPGEGTGLGLSLSYTIVVQGHNGTMTTNSQLGEFAEFILTLPDKE